MGGVVKSKIAAWIALAIVVVVIGLTFSIRAYWWSFIDIFFAFMTVFLHLMALYIGRMSPAASRKLDFIAMIGLTLTVLSLIGEYIAWNFIFDL